MEFASLSMHMIPSTCLMKRSKTTSSMFIAFLILFYVLRLDYPYLSNHGVDINGWNMERGYMPEDTFLSFPLRVVSTGHKTALKVTLRATVADMDMHCSGSIQGFKLILHTPSNMPKVAQDYIRIPINNEVLLAAKPNIITTTDKLRTYEPQM